MYKILQINCVYNYGSTGVITKNIHEALIKSGLESVVLYGRKQNSKEKNVIKTCTEVEAKAWNVISRFTGSPYNVAPFGTRKLIKLLKHERPDLVHLQCINGFFVNIYELLDYLKSNKIPTVVTLHAEFMYTGNCGHALECDEWKRGCNRCADVRRAIRSIWRKTTNRNWIDMKSAFDGFEKIQICAVSDWVKMRAEQSPILNQYSIETVLNGIDTKTFFYNEKSAYEFRKNNGWGNRKVILHVTANYKNPEKGGGFVTELSKALDKNKYIIVVVDGNDNPTPDDFYGVYWGRAKNQKELVGLYSAADVTVITSKRETFSMVCAESLCCGTPIIGFKAGAPEMISLPQYSKFVEYGNINALKENIENAYFGEKKEIEETAKKKYSQGEMVSQYMKIYTDMCD